MISQPMLKICLIDALAVTCRRKAYCIKNFPRKIERDRVHLHRMGPIASCSGTASLLRRLASSFIKAIGTNAETES